MWNNLEIVVWEDWARSQIRILFYRISGTEREVYNFYSGEIKTMKSGEEIPDSFIMKIPAVLADEFLQQFAEILDKKNIKTDKDAKIQGIMEAQKYHLEDMRKLVFKE